MPAATKIATVQGTWSGDSTAHAGLEGLISSTGAEGSRTFTLINPATSDKQPALGTAGTPSTDVISVQGNSAGTPLNTIRKTATATLTNTAGSASSVTVVSLNTARLGLVIVNDSTAVLRLKFGSPATSSSFTYLLQSGDTLELTGTIYTGTITGIWDTATGAARATELT